MHISDKTKNIFLDLLNNDSDEEDENNECCLISKQPLSFNYITLKCGHKFNYEPLLKEIIIQKKKRNPLNITILAINEVQCPYCRTVHPKLLPFIPIENYKSSIQGVTAPKYHCMVVHTCLWKFKSGKKKNECCGKPAYETKNGVFCSTHQKCFKPKEPVLSWNEEMESLKKYKVVELKDILHKNNLKKTGNKNVLISRIVSNKISVST